MQKNFCLKAVFHFIRFARAGVAASFEHAPTRTNYQRLRNT